MGSGTAEVDAEVVIGRHVEGPPAAATSAPDRQVTTIAASPAPDWRNQQSQQQQ